jgi:hypothetical protein
MLGQIKRHWALSGVAALVLVLAVAFVLSFYFELYGDVCAKNEYTNQPDCERYRIGPYIGLLAVHIVDKYNGIITAAATALLAVITYRLSSLARDQAITTNVQLKAYIFIDRAVMQHIRTDEGRDFIEACVAVKNTGTTPAYKFTSWHDGVILTKHGAPNYKKSVINETEQGHTIVGPNCETHFIRRVEMKGVGVPAIRSREKILHFWGRYDYIDAFGDSRYYEFFLKQGNFEPPNLWSLIPAEKPSKGN